MVCVFRGSFAPLGPWHCNRVLHRQAQWCCPCLRGDIALAPLRLAMLLAFWGVWVLTGQSQKAGARIAGPFQTTLWEAPPAMHGSAKRAIPCLGNSSYCRHACMCRVARLIVLVVYSRVPLPGWMSRLPGPSARYSILRRCSPRGPAPLQLHAAAV